MTGKPKINQDIWFLLTFIQIAIDDSSPWQASDEKEWILPSPTGLTAQNIWTYDGGRVKKEQQETTRNNNKHIITVESCISVDENNEIQIGHIQPISKSICPILRFQSAESSQL